MARKNISILALLVAIAVLRMAATYRIFSATADEATHVGGGMELYQFHRYQLQRINPPAARAVIGILPTLGGMRFEPWGDYGSQLHSVFYGPGKYERKLFLARVGNAFFLILAAVALFFHVRKESDELAAVVAAFLFTFEPVILGHGGLATNDMAATAGLALALLAFARWLRNPTIARAALLGAAWAFAILCKFSNLAFVPLACLGMGVVRLISDGENRPRILRSVATLSVIPFVTALGIWAGYVFTIGTLGDLEYVHGAFGAPVEQLIRTHPSMPIPAPDFFFGLGHIRLIDAGGHLSYFRGKASKVGWPLYFPATFLLKTTLAMIVFMVAGAWFTRRMPVLRRLWLESTSVALILLAFSSRSHLDLGIRYVLPVFAPLTIAAAAGATAMIRARRGPMIACALLLAWHAAASIAAHPDYFPYFNFLAGRDPSRILIDSNLDWGQDVLRLRREVRRLRVDRLGTSLMGGVDVDAIGFPPHYDLDAQRPATGWCAVSDHMLRMDEAVFGGWRWLAGAKFLRVGKSIRLYHIGSSSLEGLASILLPVAGTADEVQFPFGLRWRIRQLVRNDGPQTAHIETNACARTASCSFDLAAGQTTAILGTYGKPPYVILRTAREAAGQLRTWTVVERTDPAARGFAMPVPDVREDDFATRIVLTNVPLSAAARLNLRAWALRASNARFTVALTSAGAQIAQRSFAAGPDGFFTSGDLLREFPELAGRAMTADVVVTLDAGEPRLWACVTATDNATNLPRLIVP